MPLYLCLLRRGQLSSLTLNQLQTLELCPLGAAEHAAAYVLIDAI